MIIVMIWHFFSKPEKSGQPTQINEFNEFLSDPKLCQSGLDQHSGISLFQKGLFYRKTALLNAKIQEKYLKALYKDVKNDLKNHSKIYYYLGLALYAQKRWNDAFVNFEKSTEGEFTNLMKAACLKHMNNETAFLKRYNQLSEYYKQLCHLRINFEHPLSTKITLSPKDLSPIENKVWSSCLNNNLDSVYKDTDLQESGEHQIQGHMNISYYNPINFYYLSSLFLEKSKEMILQDFDMYKRESYVKEKLSDNKKRAVFDCVCMSHMLLHFKDYENALILLDNLKHHIPDPFVLQYLSLFQARIKARCNHIEWVKQTLLDLKQTNNFYIMVQVAKIETEYQLQPLSSIQDFLLSIRPEDCKIPHSQQWGIFCNGDCVQWNHAMGRTFINQKDFTTALLYFQEAYSSENKNDKLYCHSIDYIIDLLRVEFECGNEDLILEYILNASRLEKLVPEISQMRFSLAMIERYK